MNFEQKLKEKLKQKILERAKMKLKYEKEEAVIRNQKTFGYRNRWTEVLTGIEDLIWGYIENYTDVPIGQAQEVCERFLESVSNESLNNMKKDIQLTEEEERYLIYEGIKEDYDNYRISPILQVLLRRKLIEFLKKYLEIDKANEMLKKESKIPIRQKEYIYELITGGFFKSQEQLKERIEKQTELWFNDRINCGGYALELDTCVFNHSNDFEKAVSELLKKVPFIRLLGDKKLADDEYLVIWKVHEGGGHHFIKVQEDGTVIEKDGCDPIKMFSGWSQSLEGCPEVVFAVKKEHNMYLTEDEDEFKLVTVTGEDGQNFEESAQQAIREQSNSFEYHNHLYYFKKDDDGSVYICSEGRIVADAFIEGEQCLVDILESEKRYVSNTQPLVPLCIKDGKIANGNDITGFDENR